MLHEIIGNTFDLKTFYDEYPKILQEFEKRIDPDLPFYYWTGTETLSFQISTDQILLVLSIWM